MSWVCPSCDRQFGRRNQSHECAPAMTLDEYFSTGPERERPIYEAVVTHLRSLGEVHVEPVSVGIFIKRERSFVELRPKVRWVAMSFPMPRRLEHPRIARYMSGSGATTYHVINLHDASEVDDEVRDLLTQAWFALP
jgi:Domain of unknown function (DUF5655)